jgi:hypothetical protein
MLCAPQVPDVQKQQRVEPFALRRVLDGPLEVEQAHVCAEEVSPSAAEQHGQSKRVRIAARARRRTLAVVSHVVAVDGAGARVAREALHRQRCAVRHRSCTRCAPLRRHRRSRARLRHCSCTAHTKQEQERERLRDGARGVSRPRVATCQLRIRRTLDRERQPLWRWNGVACSSTATEVNVCGSGCSVRSALQRTPSAPQKHAGMQRRFGSGRARSPGVQPRGPAACARLRQRCMGCARRTHHARLRFLRTCTTQTRRICGSHHAVALRRPAGPHASRRRLKMAEF